MAHILLGDTISDPLQTPGDPLDVLILVRVLQPPPHAGSKDDHGVPGVVGLSPGWQGAHSPASDSSHCLSSQVCFSSGQLWIKGVLGSMSLPHLSVWHWNPSPISIHAAGFLNLSTFHVRNFYHSNHSSSFQILIPSASMSFSHFVLSNNLVTVSIKSTSKSKCRQAWGLRRPMAPTRNTALQATQTPPL